MKWTRRRFLYAAGGATTAAAAGLALSSNLFPTRARSLTAFAAPLLVPADDETLITILHTNDQHSQIDPLPANDRNGGKGGVARRATLVKRIRKENPNTLLVDAGDSFQGTPYFNLYKGVVEYKTMTAVGYDVVTLGNHDFDNGIEGLAEAMKHAKFEFVSANYDVTGTAIASRVKPYVVRELGGIRIGLFGLGIKLEGLNPPESFKGLKYLDPVRMARGVTRLLREREKCSMVVCMSHLGYYPKPQGDELGDSQLVAQVDGIDFIASGHTHTFMQQPVLARQPSGKDTVIFQVGKSGIYLGRVDFTVRRNKVTAYAGRLLDLRDGALATV
ncbi:MAG TPA: metallophosphatase [Pyrinomonadaceae bacterium]|jgi:5'-nucleotidase|nr:metallophosphatase [Pyrinomonadaceae bacterium]